MTFSDPVGWPRSTARSASASEHAASPDEDISLPPLPTLEPLPRLKPLAPMPGLPWDDDPPHLSWPVAPPPPANHPAASSTSHTDPPPPPAADAAASTSGAAPYGAAQELAPPRMTQPAAEPPLVNRATEPIAPPTPRRVAEPPVAGAWPFVAAEPVTESPLTATEQFFAAESAGTVATAPADTRSVATGRHASVPSTRPDDALPFAPRLRVLVVGGAEPLGGMVTERLIDAGHRLAVHGVTVPPELPPSIEVDGERYRVFQPIALAADRSDAEDMVHTVARAEVALGGLDALVMLPAQHGSGVSLDADAGTWADEWSMALTTEVLAAACATHIAARSFLARRRAGRIVLVTNGLDGAQSGAMPAAATRAALTRLGVDLTRELSPHGIGVSVVATGTGGTRDFAVAQVADVVEALLATPVLSGVSSQVG